MLLRKWPTNFGYARYCKKGFLTVDMLANAVLRVDLLLLFDVLHSNKNRFIFGKSFYFWSNGFRLIDQQILVTVSCGQTIFVWLGDPLTALQIKETVSYDQSIFVWLLGRRDFWVGYFLSNDSRSIQQAIFSECKAPIRSKTAWTRLYVYLDYIVNWICWMIGGLNAWLVVLNPLISVLFYFTLGSGHYSGFVKTKICTRRDIAKIQISAERYCLREVFKSILSTQ